MFLLLRSVFWDSSIIMAQLVKVLSSFHVGLSSLQRCSPIPLEAGCRLLMGSQGSTKPSATAQGSHSHLLGAKNWVWVEPGETLRQKYLDHIAINGKMQADVHATRALARSRIQIPNSAWGEGCAPWRADSPHLLPLTNLQGNGGSKGFSLGLCRSCYDTFAFLSIVPEHPSMKTGDSPRDLYTSPYSCTGHTPGTQSWFNRILMILKRERTVRRQTIPLAIFPQNSVLFAWSGNN